MRSNRITLVAFAVFILALCGCLALMVMYPARMIELTFIAIAVSLAFVALSTWVSASFSRSYRFLVTHQFKVCPNCCIALEQRDNGGICPRCGVLYNMDQLHIEWGTTLMGGRSRA